MAVGIVSAVGLVEIDDPTGSRAAAWATAWIEDRREREPGGLVELVVRRRRGAERARQNVMLTADMREKGRSGCPVNLTLEILGDRWSLIVLRYMMFGNQRH